MSLATHGKEPAQVSGCQIGRHQPFPHLADAVVLQAGRILEDLRELARQGPPQLDGPSIADHEHEIACMLNSLALALKAPRPENLRAMLDSTPAYGLIRHRRRRTPGDLIEEDRLLRSVIIRRIEERLGRTCTMAEAVTLHALIDAIHQQNLLAVMQEDQKKAREAMEAERQYISFLTHDLTHHLFIIAARLEAIRSELPEGSSSVKLLHDSLTCVRKTRQGMRRLLEFEHLRNVSERPPVSDVKLHEAVAAHVRPLAEQAQQQGVCITNDIPPDLTVATDDELLSLILQNLIGNAVKFTNGSVRIHVRPEQRDGADYWDIAVSDDGPGIEQHHLEHIYDAFYRGETLSTRGVGLGLCIASQAAAIINAKLDVQTEVGAGSTFHCLIPAPVRL